MIFVFCIGKFVVTILCQKQPGVRVRNISVDLIDDVGVELDHFVVVGVVREMQGIVAEIGGGL